MRKFEIGVPIWRLLQLGVEGLEVPDGMQAQVVAFIDGLRRVADKGDEVLRAGFAGDAGAFEAAVPEFFALFGDVTAASRDLGLAGCP